MKLRNKKTGKVTKLDVHYIAGKNYESLAEINAEWEDYEEPKDFWFIDPEVLIACESTEPLLCDKKVAVETMKQIGNYFETKEEAEKAVEKLKAWKRLKDKGFSLDAVVDTFFCLDIFISDEPYKEIKDDLKIVFGGEE